MGIITHLESKVFFDLGIAFSRFSAIPDREEYAIIEQTALLLDLDMPEYDVLRGNHLPTPPQKWFLGPSEQSRRNFYRIGVLTFALFLLKNNRHTGAIHELRSLYEVERLPESILDAYLSDLDGGDPSASLRSFLSRFYQFLRQRSSDPDPDLKSTGPVSSP